MLPLLTQLNFDFSHIYKYKNILMQIESQYVTHYIFHGIKTW